jgi:hypothetical protein
VATTAQREALLAVPCPWCGAGVGEVCTLPAADRIDTEGGRRRHRPRPLTTLDGGCHDARWQRAGLGPAPVIRGAVLAAQGIDEDAQEAREAVPVGGPVERPW